MSTTRTFRRAAMLAVLALGVWAIPTWSDTQESRHSGTVVAVDRSAGVIVVEGMGPWQVKDGVTQVERRTVGVTSATEFVGVKRASGPAPSGWVGDFVESGLPGWQVKPGDWVTLIMKPGDKRPTAIRVYVWEPTEAPG
jgi:hypothetical protein